MENQKKNFTPKKEGEPRISVRPGNFIVPSERPADPRQAAPAPRADEKAAPRKEDAKHGGRHHNRRRGNRRGHGNAAPGNEQRANAPKPQQQAQQGKPAAEQKPTATGKNDRRPPRAQEKGQSRREGRPARQEQKPAAPEISANLQRELDAQFAAPTSSAYFRSPVAEAEKKLSESGAVDTKEFEVDIATAAYLVEDVPCGFPAPDGKAIEVIGVRFRQAGKIYFFAPAGERFKIGEAAIVDTARGPEYGEVVMLNRKMPEKDIVQPLRSVLRRATDEDTAHEAENRRKEAEALKICAEKIAAHKLDMSLVDAQYTFDNSKLLFYFTSEGRVDFRELVRDLAGIFRTRIELRQIGIRDESRLIGGLGMCGRPFCCTTFLSDFGQVSVKMAKEQGLSINTSKISGCCGRLMCCLRYEHESYAAEAALTPKKDTRVMTPDGVGTVVDATPLTGMVKVLCDNAENGAPAVYHRDKLSVLAKKENAAAPAEKEETQD